jgi:D-glycero-alpha-D-manno-heptose-7-phosphate kinase
MVQAFADLLSLPLGEYEIARLAYVIERCDSKLHGGKQDQYAAAFGGFNFMEFNGSDDVLVNPLRIKHWIVSELESSLVLFYTGSSRDSAAIIEEESRNVEQKNADAIDAMQQSKLEALRMKECLLRGDLRKLASVMEVAWQAKKRMASRISNESIERYYELARESGAYCGKVSGAGGGGFMMFLVDPVKRLKVLETLTGQLGGVVLGCHFTEVGSESWRLG